MAYQKNIIHSTTEPLASLLYLTKHTGGSFSEVTNYKILAAIPESLHEEEWKADPNLFLKNLLQDKSPGLVRQDSD